MTAREFIPGRREPEIPSNALGYFFREAIRRIWVSKRTSFVAIVMIAISLLILGLFMLVSENLRRGVARWEGRSRVTIYFDAAATPPEIAAVNAYLAGQRELASRRFLSREEALRRFRSYFANMTEIVGQLEENPFPPSFEIEVSPDVVRTRAFAEKMSVIQRMPGVEQVQYDWEWLRRLRRVIQAVDIAGFIAGGILALAAAFTIANVIRLTMLLYREEIEIMRLVGATERIIRGPFLAEGFLQGFLGALTAIGLLLLSYALARHFFAQSSSMVWGFLLGAFLSWQKIAMLVAGGMLAGLFGSWLAVRSSSQP